MLYYLNMRHMSWDILLSAWQYYSKIWITYSHSSKEVNIQLHYHCKMHYCIAIKVSWYSWVEWNFFSSDLYEAKQIMMKQSLHHWHNPVWYSLVFFIITNTKGLRDIDNCPEIIYLQIYVIPSVQQSLNVCACMFTAERKR